MAHPDYRRARIGDKFDSVEDMEVNVSIEEAVWLYVTNSFDVIDLTRAEFMAVRRVLDLYFNPPDET